MTASDHLMSFMRTIKGAPVSALLALLLGDRPMKCIELERCTGYSHPVMSGALDTLTELGWISALGPKGPWVLAHEMRLALLRSLVGGSGIGNGDARRTDDRKDVVRKRDDRRPSSRGIDLESRNSLEDRVRIVKNLNDRDNVVKNFYDGSDIVKNLNDLLSSSLRTKKESLNSFEEQEEEYPGVVRKKDDRNGIVRKKDEPNANAENSDDDNPDFAANLHALLAGGIQQPTAGRLAALAHVNPEYIAAHLQAIKQEDHGLGTAVHRIGHGWAPPEVPRVDTVEDKLRRFLAS